MKLKRFLELLSSGAKITNNEWGVREYIYINSDGHLQDECGSFCLSTLSTYQIEGMRIYKEPKYQVLYRHTDRSRIFDTTVPRFSNKTEFEAKYPKYEFIKLIIPGEE